MLFLFNLIVFFSLNLSANDNPLSLEFKTSTEDFGGEVKNVLNVNVKSKSLELKEYLLIVYPPKNIDVIEGKRSYKGSIEPLKTKIHSLTFDILREGPFKVKARIYLLNENGNAILETLRYFVSEGNIVKEENDLEYSVKLEQIREVELSKQEEKEEKNDEKAIDEENNNIEEQQYTNNIVVDIKKDKSNFLKYVFLLFSLGIIWFLIYLLKKNKYKD